MSTSAVSRPTHSRARSAQNLCLLVVNMSPSGRMTLPVVDPSTGHLSQYKLVPLVDREVNRKSSLNDPHNTGGSRIRASGAPVANSKVQSAALLRRRGAARRTLSEGGIPPVQQRLPLRTLQQESVCLSKSPQSGVRPMPSPQVASVTSSDLEYIADSTFVGKHRVKRNQGLRQRQGSLFRICPLPPSSPARVGMLDSGVTDSLHTFRMVSVGEFPSGSSPALLFSPQCSDSLPRVYRCPPSPESLVVSSRSRLKPTAVYGKPEATHQGLEDISDDASLEYDIADYRAGISSAPAQTPARRLFYIGGKAPQENSASGVSSGPSSGRNNEREANVGAGVTADMSGSTLVGLGLSGILKEDGTPFDGLGLLPRTRSSTRTPSTPLASTQSAESPRPLWLGEDDVTEAHAPYLSYGKFVSTSDSEYSELSQRLQTFIAASTQRLTPTAAARRASVPARALPVEEEDVFLSRPVLASSSAAVAGPGRKRMYTLEAPRPTVTGASKSEDQALERERARFERMELKRYAVYKPRARVTAVGSIRSEDSPERARFERVEEKRKAIWKP
ncbi:hypothetical protein OBBRIDRAFT_338808 [Obba rivulosa]|uniref:Uncharacterized protein n=1 Tax=Obba rivulosa TaxID=1052685 RepID=A0A8E2DPA9_9APHY|nr:hypothetical protein OBBRIDRAFT_338808 [Obba rivulosa]